MIGCAAGWTRRRAAWLVPVLCVITVSGAAAESPDFAATSGAITWKKLGATSGQPIIFLPALGMPGRYWSKVYEQLEKDHPIFVVTFAGSDGVPAIKPPYIDQFVEGVHQLIEKEKLVKPVLVGHLFGAHVALRVAAQYPDDVGGVFAQPMIWGKKSPDELRKDAEEQRTRYRECPPEMWVPTLTVDINGVIEDGAVAREVVALVSKADQATFAQAVYEMFVDDLASQLPKIKVPVFLISPVFVSSKRIDIDKNYERMASLAARRRDMLFEQFPNIARCDMLLMRNWQFFSMLEAPGRLGFSLSRFVKRLGDPNSTWDTTALHPAGDPKVE